jgi:hypothetical protein
MNRMKGWSFQLENEVWVATKGDQRLRDLCLIALKRRIQRVER